MYTQEDMNLIGEQLKKRRLIVMFPSLLVVAIGAIAFVYGQFARSEWLWMLTVALTIVGGGTCLFFYGVWIRPLSLYQKNVHYMLFGQKRVTTGVFKSFSADLSDRDGLDCYAVILNVGDDDDEMDDRLFYYDAHQPKPEIAFGTKVTVESNDKMIAKFELA